MKLNLGCGNDYKEGYFNVDFNKEVKADLYIDFNSKLPFEDNSADLILLDNVIEHIQSDKLFDFIDELYRICKDGSIIQIYTPHYSSVYAFKHLAHHNYFGIGSFDIFKEQQGFNGERYSKARFQIIKERLLFFHHNLVNFGFLSKLPLNWLFNFNKTWQQIMERFQFFGFDEIYFELKVKKVK